MKHEGIKHVALALTLALSAVSCGSGSSNLAEGGIGGTGISMGTVSAIGSIWVNGVEYDTTGATIIYADEGLQEVDTKGTAGGDTLRLGMVLTVKGSINADGVSGTATSVTYADSLEGPISDKPNANTIVVLGQNVIVDSLTKDENGGQLNDATTLSVNEWVEVSGFLDANGSIHATYIERKATSGEVELKGAITLVDSSHFTINGLTVVVADTTGLNNGDLVEVKGLTSNLLGNTLTASSVELRTAVLDSEDHAEAEMEGIVTSSVTPSGEFTLGSQLVSIASGAEFNGGLVANIVPGVRLEVEGSFSGGLLTAEKISFEDGIELEANILSTDVPNNTITLNGLVTLGGQNLQVKVDDVLTDIEGAASLAALNPGDHVKIRARDTGTELLAIKLAATVSEQNIVLQGPLEAKDQSTNSVTVLGIEASGFGGYEIDSMGSVTDTTFFNIVKVNDLVELKGTWVAGVLSWDSIELDD